MIVDDILDAIGEVDAALVKSAKESRISNKRLIATISALAACLIIANIIIPPLLLFGGASDKAPQGDHWGDETVGLVWVYYVEDGSISRYRGEVTPAADEVFNEWRAANGVGDEVVLFEARLSLIYDNQTNKYVNLYVIEVSQNLETYINADVNGLLTETLKRTMIEYQFREDERIEFRLVLK